MHLLFYALPVLLFHQSRNYVAAQSVCACSSVVIPVHVDVLVPKDPTDEFAGLKSNASELRRVDATYDIYGIFCEPATTVSSQNNDVVQLLVHGFTYTSQYWSPPVEEFRNHSYASFSCGHGFSSFAVDVLGAGLSSRPVNASDVQYPTSAAALSQVARYLKTTSLLPGVPAFNKVIGIGHSAGSGLLDFGTIVEGPQSPFDALILTASLGTKINTSTLPTFTSARDVDPLRWGSLDLGYVTVSNRSLFYPTDTSTFSPRMVLLDEFTMDVGTVGTFEQTGTIALTTGYFGPVAKVVGSEDQLFCTGTDRCEDVEALTAAERTLWPAAQSFKVVVEEGSGHDMNLDFFADGPFNTLVRFVKQFSAS
ncbi:hypothetical protein C8F04DRAFT_1010483 [Mycena alexandri]|uniref:AB hydrolase-1 domain-containing protein n=1 Tax=Mycena alexandri TaxID=1745969 RepID=A0AAD6WTS5_9AGAR|nr:hypothetical protein C8F04DRAFT_1010483 [Mycena alexandri]